MGPGSCYARREGFYVARLGGRGVDTVLEAAAILYLIWRDLQRGYTYDPDRGCRRVRMTWELAERRARFLVLLAARHGGPRVAARVRRLVERFLRTGSPPRTVAGVSVASLLRRMARRRRGR